MNEVLPEGWTTSKPVGGWRQMRLPNGLELLVLVDRTRPLLTVNMTCRVGSRVEQIGERGMAHLLEHLLFKGTPSCADIPGELRRRGARFNGTTSVDRTNYYESLPDDDGNLEFAVRLEAERLSQAIFDREQFRAEIDVVCNELLRSESRPQAILSRRVMSAAFGWHGYGKPTIGLVDELRAMTFEQVRDFYRRWYQPAGTVLVVAGDVAPERVAEVVDRQFGGISSAPSWTSGACGVEPEQDGERMVRLPCESGVGEVMAAYHIPSGAHGDAPALHVAARVLGLRPTGRLYRELVESGLAVQVSAAARRMHDPGVFVATTRFDRQHNAEEIASRMLEELESAVEWPVTEEELQRAQNEISTQFEYEMADAHRWAVALSEWIALGDWRWYFAHLSSVIETAASDVKRVCGAYFIPTNRSVGYLEPVLGARHVSVPPRAELPSDVGQRAARFAVAAGEPIDGDWATLEKVSHTEEISGRIELATARYATRGELVTLLMHVRFGNERTLVGQQTATDLLAEWLPRGTRRLPHEAFRDELRRLRAWISAAPFRGGLEIECQVPRSNLGELMTLIGEWLRSPALDRQEFAIVRRAAAASLEQQLTQPGSVANNRLRRELTRFPADDARHVLSLEVELEQVMNCPPEDCLELFSGSFEGAWVQMAAVGNVDATEVADRLTDWPFSDERPSQYERIVEAAASNAPGVLRVDVKEASIAAIVAGWNLAMNEDHPDYAALVVANHVLGCGSLASRLGREIRGRLGLTYSIGSSLYAHPIDTRGRWAVAASTEPKDWERLVRPVQRELERLAELGINDEELSAAKTDLLKSRRQARTAPRYTASLLASALFAGVWIERLRRREQAIADLKLGDVNRSISRWVRPDELTVVVAGPPEI